MAQTFESLYPRVAKTAAYTVVAGDHGTMFTNRGQTTGTVTFTLPALTAVPDGTKYYFYAAAVQTIAVTAPAANTLCTYTSSIATSLSCAGVAGVMLEVFNDNQTSWNVIEHSPSNIPFTVA